MALLAVALAASSHVGPTPTGPASVFVASRQTQLPRVMCALNSDGDAPAAPATSRWGRATTRLRQLRVVVAVACATSAAFGGARPSLSYQRSEAPPELEAAFRREKFTNARLRDLGVDPDKVVDDHFLFSEKRHAVSDVQQEIYDLDDGNSDEAQIRWKFIAGFGAAAVVMSQLVVKGAKGLERYLADRDEAERQREIELTGTYVNPFAGDIDEIVDPVTGEKRKLDKKKAERKKEIEDLFVKPDPDEDEDDDGEVPEEDGTDDNIDDLSDLL